MRSFRFVVAAATLLGQPIPSFAQVVTPPSSRLAHDYRGLSQAPPAFVIADTPSVQIQPTPGDGLILTGLHTLITLRDGRIAIAAKDPGTDGRHSVQLYDPTGRFIRRAPIRGGQFLAGIELLREMPDGSMLGAGRRAWTIFDDSGRIIRATDFNAPTAVGILASGSVVARSRADIGDRWAVGGSQFVMSSASYVRASQNGLMLTPLAVRTERPLTSISTSGSNGDLAPWPILVVRPLVTASSLVWTFDAMKWEGRAYDTVGVVQASFIPPQPRVLAGAVRGGPYPLDSVGGVEMLTDDAGRLWLEAGNAPLVGDTGPVSRVWWVFDTTGSLLGSVSMPRGFRALHISRDRILGLLTAPGIIRSVAQFRILPPSRP